MPDINVAIPGNPVWFPDAQAWNDINLNFHEAVHEVLMDNRQRAQAAAEAAPAAPPVVPVVEAYAFGYQLKVPVWTGYIMQNKYGDVVASEFTPDYDPDENDYFPTGRSQTLVQAERFEASYLSLEEAQEF